MNTLDRYLAWQFVRNLALVASAMIVVFLGLDVLMNFHLLTRQADSPWVKVQLFLGHVPALLNFAIPISAVVSAMACAAPMLRRGEFTALGAAGITLQRSTRMLLIGCLAAGAADAVLADLVTPPATARAIVLQDILEGQSREGRVWRSEDGATWFAGATRLFGPKQPLLRRLVVASPDRLALIESLAWDGRRWTAPTGAVVLRIEAGAQLLERHPPGILPGHLDMTMPPAALHRLLLPRYTMTTSQLVNRGERADLTAVWSRWSRALFPVLAAAVVLAHFIRFRNRDRIAVATIESVALALIPTAILATAGMAADSAPGPAGMVVVVGAAIAAAVSAVMWWRWRL